MLKTTLFSFVLLFINIGKIYSQCANSGECGDGYCCKYTGDCACSETMCIELCTHGGGKKKKKSKKKTSYSKAAINKIPQELIMPTPEDGTNNITTDNAKGISELENFLNQKENLLKEEKKLLEAKEKVLLNKYFGGKKPAGQTSLVKSTISSSTLASNKSKSPTNSGKELKSTNKTILQNSKTKFHYQPEGKSLHTKMESLKLLSSNKSKIQGQNSPETEESDTDFDNLPREQYIGSKTMDQVYREEDENNDHYVTKPRAVSFGANPINVKSLAEKDALYRGSHPGNEMVDRIYKSMGDIGSKTESASSFIENIKANMGKMREGGVRENFFNVFENPGKKDNSKNIRRRKRKLRHFRISN